MSNKIFFANSLIGGGAGSLDQIDGTALVDLDAAVAILEGKAYLYSLDADSALPESSPDIIAPDTNAGTKRWILTDLYTRQDTFKRYAFLMGHQV